MVRFNQTWRNPLCSQPKAVLKLGLAVLAPGSVSLNPSEESKAPELMGLQKELDEETAAFAEDRRVRRVRCKRLSPEEKEEELFCRGTKY